MRILCRCGFLPTACGTAPVATQGGCLPSCQVAPDDIKTQWQEANANRRMLFKVGDYKDSNIRMLTGTIKADWIQLPVERYLTALPTLKQGVIAGVFKIKGAAPWAEKLQLSVFLPKQFAQSGRL